MSAKKLLNPTSLTEEQQDILIEDCLNGGKLVTSALALGFKNKLGLWRFLQKNQELNNHLKQARLDSCDFLEDEILHVCTDVKDAKMARVKLEAICRILAFRNPAKYGQRIDLNVNQNISIKANLDESNKRIEELVRDVTPQLIATGVTDSIKVNN